MNNEADPTVPLGEDELVSPYLRRRLRSIVEVMRDLAEKQTGPRGPAIVRSTGPGAPPADSD